MSHSCCKAAIEEVLEGSEAKRRLPPHFIYVHVNNTTANGEGESTCPNTVKGEIVVLAGCAKKKEQLQHLHITQPAKKNPNFDT